MVEQGPTSSRAHDGSRAAMMFVVNRRALAGCVVLLAAALSRSAGALGSARDGQSTAAGRESVLAAVEPPTRDLDLGERPRGLRASLPGPVSARVSQLVDRQFQRWRADCREPDDCRVSRDAFVRPVQKIATPLSADLYVADVTYPVPGGYYYFMLCRPGSAALTPDPPRIFDKWMKFWPIDPPVVSFADFDRDGRPELVVRELVHNGNVYDAVMTHYYAIGAALELRHALAVESDSMDVLTRAEDGRLKRAIQAVSPLELRLTATLVRSGQPPEVVGEAMLNRLNSTSPFRISSRRVFNAKYKGLIVTSSEISDDKILAEGYRFYY